MAAARKARTLLVTGAAGRLGRMLAELAPHARLAHRQGGAAVPGSVPLDLTAPASCRAVIEETAPHWVVHPAGLTDVDACERYPEAAHTVNAVGSGALAKAASEAGARFVYVSTDYVFDGARGAYREDDEPAPVNHYGRSKLMGERAVLDAAPDAIIARTTVVFGPHKNDFVRWVARELSNGRSVRVAVDQRATPTYSGDVAAQILALVEADASGIFHTAGATALSRFEMAQATAREFGFDASRIVPVPASELPWVARRPLNATLDTTKVAKYCAPMTFDAALRELHRELERRDVPP